MWSTKRKAKGVAMLEPEPGNVYWVGSYLAASGLSINSYLIVDESPTLINAGAPITIDILIRKIESIIDIDKLEYIVLNNADISYAGGLKPLLELAPRVRVVTTNYEAFRLGLYGV